MTENHLWTDSEELFKIYDSIPQKILEFLAES